MDEKGKKPEYQKGLLEKAVVASVQITRYAVKGQHENKHKVVLSTDGEIAFVEKGVTNWKLDLAAKRAIALNQIDTPHVTVKARWYTTQEALEKGIEVVYGGSANTFGSLGALLVPDGFNIPTVMATAENVKYYGLQLIANGEDFAISSDQFQIAMMKYDYSGDYKKDFLMQKYGGGGLFVETHNFPHIHIPLHETCGGYIVIGKQVSAKLFNFTAFQIPYGFALYTPSYTIHGDGTLVGEYGLTVADSAMASADTVLIYNKDRLAMARNVVPNWKP
ncbi:MAG: hypothetical protein COW18_12855 [Zetaproteobacteria bacterium CG12_big_fil_rev_8_21_14_0_65_54_13]|nr:MAG: hypothetical protein COW18_12855 [Zetaproteobacteria bacterium CG12_big_fil_rev_8_21_14_0_65_54_13]PIX53245.1 MAG: hypothetical protein COZ50_14320 [Zetaproteobacteria bacterium CG_4_10_14_3_um_filter_54_28]PJA30601.1 MAG: hypothetical protein CO188_02990 [Zetaproteobacteria bacterium CG_4_9_14_3_um_filter_54_145]